MIQFECESGCIKAASPQVLCLGIFYFQKHLFLLCTVRVGFAYRFEIRLREISPITYTLDRISIKNAGNYTRICLT